MAGLTRVQAPHGEPRRIERFLLIHLPAFRLERCGHDADDRVGLVDEVKSATRLVALTPGARSAGLRLGMTAAEARALVPDVELHPLDAEGERIDRAALARAFEAISDRVAFPWDDALITEISRTAGVFGGEGEAVARARQLARALGHRCQLVVADDPLAALALAACSRDDIVVLPGRTAEALAPLPLTALTAGGALGASMELVAGLRAVGIDRIGQLAKLDPASVSGRYGPVGVRAHQVARGLPASVPALDWSPLQGELPRASTPVAGATSTLQLHVALPGLLGSLSEQLAARDLAVVRLRVGLRLERGPQADTGAHPSLLVGLGRPTRSATTLARLIRKRLEGVRVDAPVDELVLEVVEAVPDQGWQPGLTDRTEATEPLPELLARLRDHLGDDGVFTAELVDAWRPEGTWRAAPVASSLPRPAPDAPDRDLLGAPIGAWSDDPVEVQSAWEQALEVPRPTVLLPSPARIEVTVRDGRPVRVRLPDQAPAGVLRAEGPERLQGEWWSPSTRFDRSYWAVQLTLAHGAGRDAWIFEEHGHWYLHGWFD